MKVFVKFVGSVFFVDLRLSQEPHIPTTLYSFQFRRQIAQNDQIDVAPCARSF